MPRMIGTQPPGPNAAITIAHYSILLFSRTCMLWKTIGMRRATPGIEFLYGFVLICANNKETCAAFAEDFLHINPVPARVPFVSQANPGTSL